MSEDTDLEALNSQLPGSPPPTSSDDDAVSMEDLRALAVDNAKADETTAKLLDPPGTYLSQPNDAGRYLSVTAKKNDEGRLVIRLWGIGQRKDGTRGKISVSLSPEYREKLNPQTGASDPDYMTKRFTEARNAYRATFGENPADLGALAEYLEQSPLAFRIIQMGVPTKTNPEPTGEPGNLVVQISAVQG